MGVCEAASRGGQKKKVEKSASRKTTLDLGIRVLGLTSWDKGKGVMKIKGGETTW